jgi:hypothetical protein
MLSHTFNDSNLARGAGQSICEACVFCLQERTRDKPGVGAKLTPEQRSARRRAMKDPRLASGGVLGLRMFSFLATSDRLLLPERSEWRDLLLSPPDPPWTGAIATSGQKHLALRATVNWSNPRPTVLLEMTPTTYSPTTLAADLAVLEDLLTVFSKTEVAAGQYKTHRIREFGLDRFSELADRVERMKLRRREFDLALFVARKTERVEAVQPGLAAKEVTDDTPDLPLFQAAKGACG